MNLCDKGHAEVCYETKLCPCCELLLEIEELKVQLEQRD